MITTAAMHVPAAGTLVVDVLAAPGRQRLAFLDRLSQARPPLGLRCDDSRADLWTVVPADEPGALVAPAGAP